MYLGCHRIVSPVRMCHDIGDAPTVSRSSLQGALYQGKYCSVCSVFISLGFQVLKLFCEIKLFDLNTTETRVHFSLKTVEQKVANKREIVTDVLRSCVEKLI